MPAAGEALAPFAVTQDAGFNKLVTNVDDEVITIHTFTAELHQLLKVLYIRIA